MNVPTVKEMLRSLFYLAIVIAGAIAASCGRFNRPDPVSTAIEVEHAAPSVPVVVETAHFRIATYNVHGGSAETLGSEVRGNAKLDKADVILLQEIEHHADETSSQAALIARKLGMSYAYAPGYGLSGGGSHGVAILSRYPISDVRVIELPRYDVHYNSARRVALGATVHVGRETVRVYSVHLDNRINPAERVAQLQPLLDAAASQDIDAVVIGGDLNTSPFCWINHVVPVPCGLQARRLERFARSKGFDTPVTDSGATSKWLSMRLDAIYTRGVEVTRFRVERSVRTSDHLPLWADVQLAVH